MTPSPPHEIEFTELQVGLVYLVKKVKQVQSIRTGTREQDVLPVSLEKNGRLIELVEPGEMLLCLEIDPWFTQAKFLQVSNKKKVWILFQYEGWLKLL